MSSYRLLLQSTADFSGFFTAIFASCAVIILFPFLILLITLILAPQKTWRDYSLAKLLHRSIPADQHPRPHHHAIPSLLLFLFSPILSLPLALLAWLISGPIALLTSLLVGIKRPFQHTNSV